VVAEWRRHGANMTRNPALMWNATLTALRNQRKHVKGDKRYKEAYRTGVRTAKEYYGIPLAREVLDHAREREWKEAIRDLRVLLRYHPWIFARLFTRGWRKLRSPASSGR
jgi:hypothetical protein